MSLTIPAAEAFIRFQLDQLSSRNEHHTFEAIAARIARRRVSTNILLAGGPVSAGGDQQRDAESYTTRIPDDLPYSSGFAATASSEPVVLACTTQKANLKAKIESDLSGIVVKSSEKVSRVAYFSVASVPSGARHKLQEHARTKHEVELSIFAGDDLSTLLAEPDLVWIAEYYLDLPSDMVPDPPGTGAAPTWYVDLLSDLRSKVGHVVPTPGQQAAIATGLRYATFTAAVNADLPEWIDFMAEVVDKVRGFASADGQDVIDEMVFRARYEISVASLRGLGTLDGVEDMIRQAIDIALQSASPTIITDAAALVTYWGGAWSLGSASASPEEISRTVNRLRAHSQELLDDFEHELFPVRACALISALAFLAIIPNYEALAADGLRPSAEPVLAPGPDELARVVRGSRISSQWKAHVDLDGAMGWLAQLVDLLPAARPFSAETVAGIFQDLAPSLLHWPEYARVRDGLDAATAAVQGEDALATRCRDRGMALYEADCLIECLPDLHAAKEHWFHGGTMGGSILTLRVLAQVYSELGLSWAAKQHAAVAARVAELSVDEGLRPLVADAVIDMAVHVQGSGMWFDAAALAHAAAGLQFALQPSPFDTERYPQLGEMLANAGLQLAVIRRHWATLEAAYISELGDDSWSESVQAQAGASAAEIPPTEEEVLEFAAANATSRLLGDVGSTRTVDFAGLGVVWRVSFVNSAKTAQLAEAICAATQVTIADFAPFEPVLASTQVEATVVLDEKAPPRGDISPLEQTQDGLKLTVTVPPATGDIQERGQLLTSIAVVLLAVVQLRPDVEFQQLVEQRMRAGLPNKVLFGSSYEDAAQLLGDEHYERLAELIRPPGCEQFAPAEHPSLAAAVSDGPGYDRNMALSAIEDRYRAIQEMLPHTLPSFVASTAGRELITELRQDGWLDWHITSALANFVGNARLRAQGIDPSPDADIAALRTIMMAPETERPIEADLDDFTRDEVQIYLDTVVALSAKQWELDASPTSRQEIDSLLALLDHRYHFRTDDVPHTDLLECVGDAGGLVPLLPANRRR